MAQFDVETAFLTGVFEEEIWAVLTGGISNFHTQTSKLEKTI